MPVGYATSVAFMALFTWLAVALPAGLLVEHLPFVALAWLTASTALAAVDGDT